MHDLSTASASTAESRLAIFSMHPSCHSKNSLSLINPYLTTSAMPDAFGHFPFQKKKTRQQQRWRLVGSKARKGRVVKRSMIDARGPSKRANRHPWLAIPQMDDNRNYKKPLTFIFLIFIHSTGMKLTRYVKTLNPIFQTPSKISWVRNGIHLFSWKKFILSRSTPFFRDFPFKYATTRHHFQYQKQYGKEKISAIDSIMLLFRRVAGLTSLKQ